MQPELYIPPCCITKQLPTLVHTHGSHGWFYSRGDWGFSRLWKALSSLVSHDDKMSICTVLVIPDVDIFCLRYLCYVLGMKWTTGLILITSSDRTSLVQNTLGDHLSSVTYLPNRSEASMGHGLWIRSRSDGMTLVVSGDLTHEETPAEPRFSQFSYSFLRDTSAALYAFQPWRAIIRTTKDGLRGSHPIFKQWF